MKDKKIVVTDIAAMVCGVCAGGVADYILEACMPTKLRGVLKLVYKLGALCLGLYTGDRIYKSAKEELDSFVETCEKAAEEAEQKNNDQEKIVHA